MSACKYARHSPAGALLESCNVLAGEDGYCPRHAMLVPAIAAAAEAKDRKREATKRANRLAELRRKARR